MVDEVGNEVEEEVAAEVDDKVEEEVGDRVEVKMVEIASGVEAEVEVDAEG